MDGEQTRQAPASATGHDTDGGGEAASAHRFEASANVVFRSVGEDVVMLDLDKGSYFSLNETGGEIWMRLCAGATPPEVAAALAESYEVDPQVVAQDVETTLARLLGAGLLRPVAS